MSSKSLYTCIAIATTVALLITAGLRAQSESAEHDNNDQLHGSYLGTVTVNETGRVFKSLVTFSPGGGYVESFYSRVGVLTIGQGSWARTGEGQFAITADGLAPDVMLPSGQTVSFVSSQIQHTLTLDPSGDSYDDVWVDQFFDPSGNVVLTRTGSVHATRIVAGGQ